MGRICSECPRFGAWLKRLEDSNPCPPRCAPRLPRQGHINSLWWNPGERRERGGARLTRRVREEYLVYLDRNATQSAAKRRGSGGMDRRSNAAWVSPQAVNGTRPRGGVAGLGWAPGDPRTERGDRQAVGPRHPRRNTAPERPVRFVVRTARRVVPLACRATVPSGVGVPVPGARSGRRAAPAPARTSWVSRGVRE